MSSTSVRTAVYIDGFNLYYGLKSANLRRFYWLDVCKLARCLLVDDQELVSTKYFTARIAGKDKGDSAEVAKKREEKRKRQSIYLEAITTIDGCQLYTGKYQPTPRFCTSCGHKWTHHEEKMTDVNIATELMADAYQDKYDRAVLVSADSDLVPPVRAIRTLFKKKFLVVAFPPNRRSRSLQNLAHGTFNINDAMLARCQLPDEITKPDGAVLTRPDKWKTKSTTS